jgi:hypothetical protein
MRSRLAVSCRLLFLLLALIAALPPSALALTASQVYEQVKDSVVVVKAFDQKGKLAGMGSGVRLPSGDVITNYHVVKTGVRYTVGQGKQAVPATLKAGDPDKDLCLLTAPGLTAKPARLGKAARLKVGEPVYAVGAPQGLELSLSEGIVSQLRGGPPPLIQTTVAISKGSSGGGLFNAEAELVGITTFYLKEGQSLSFAVPVEWITEIAETKPSPIAIEPKQRFETLYLARGPFHLGDEELSGWPPLIGACFEADFIITHPIQRLLLRLETYGLEITAPIYLNNQKVAVLPPQLIMRTGRGRPNEWSKDQLIDIPIENLVNGLNKFRICTDLVVKSQFPGDKDDFQFRKLRLIAE